MLSHPNPQGKDFSFKVGESMWSQVWPHLCLSVNFALNILQAVGLEAPSAESRLVIPSESRQNEEIHVGISWSEGLGKYKLTKVITLAPRFVIRNNTGEAISYREHGVAPRGRAVLEPGERAPLHFMRNGDTKLLTLAFAGLNAQWYATVSCIFCLNMGLTLLQVGTNQYRRHWNHALPSEQAERRARPSHERRHQARRTLDIHSHLPLTRVSVYHRE